MAVKVLFLVCFLFVSVAQSASFAVAQRVESNITSEIYLQPDSNIAVKALEALDWIAFTKFPEMVAHVNTQCSDALKAHVPSWAQGPVRALGYLPIPLFISDKVVVPMMVSPVALTLGSKDKLFFMAESLALGTISSPIGVSLPTVMGGKIPTFDDKFVQNMTESYSAYNSTNTVRNAVNAMDGLSAKAKVNLNIFSSFFVYSITTAGAVLANATTDQERAFGYALVAYAGIWPFLSQNASTRILFPYFFSKYLVKDQLEKLNDPKIPLAQILAAQDKAIQGLEAKNKKLSQEVTQLAAEIKLESENQAYEKLKEIYQVSWDIKERDKSALEKIEKSLKAAHASLAKLDPAILSLRSEIEEKEKLYNEKSEELKNLTKEIISASVAIHENDPELRDLKSSYHSDVKLNGKNEHLIDKLQNKLEASKKKLEALKQGQSNVAFNWLRNLREKWLDAKISNLRIEIANLLVHESTRKGVIKSTEAKFNDRLTSLTKVGTYRARAHIASLEVFKAAQIDLAQELNVQAKELVELGKKLADLKPAPPSDENTRQLAAPILSQIEVLTSQKVKIEESLKRLEVDMQSIATKIKDLLPAGLTNFSVNPVAELKLKQEILKNLPFAIEAAKTQKKRIEWYRRGIPDGQSIPMSRKLEYWAHKAATTTVVASVMTSLYFGLRWTLAGKKVGDGAILQTVFDRLHEFIIHSKAFLSSNGILSPNGMVGDVLTDAANMLQAMVQALQY